MVLTDNHDYDGGDVIPHRAHSISESVSIEDDVWLGDRVIILPGVTMGEGVICEAATCNSIR